MRARLRTLEQPVHSGQFGGAAPDALLSLVRLLATLHDDDGLLAVEGLASDARWEGRGPDAATFRRDAGVLDGVDLPGAAAGLRPADLTGPALATLSDALADAYGRDTDPGVETVHIASGGSIPLCTSLLARHPDAELALFGVEEPACRIHSSDESVDPTEIHAIGTAELLFLARTAAAGR